MRVQGLRGFAVAAWQREHKSSHE